MDTNTDQTLEPQASEAAKKPAKQSYESNADVQRWLRDQALDDLGDRPPFDPTLLAGRRDRDWILSSLAHFYDQHLIADVVAVVKSGKEATVYCCEADPSTGLEYLAAKVYRPRMFRSLSNDAIYRRNREQRDEDGRVLRGSRRARGAERKSERGRAAQVTSWIGYEYETMRLAYEAGADVPRTVAQVGNAVLMEYIGAPEEPARLLREVSLTQAETQPMFERLMWNIEQLLACHRIHGDLSAYNILYWRGAATIIDFAQAVDPRHALDVYTLLQRDIERVCRFFARYGVAADPHALATEMWMRYLCGGIERD